MTTKVGVLIGALALIATTSVRAEITLYQGEGFRGRALTTRGRIADLADTNLGHHADSVVIDNGEWEVCDSPHFDGNCVTLRAGSYDSMSSIGLEDGIVSVRSVTGHSQSQMIPPPYDQPNYDYRQRPHERTYEVPVSSVHAVMGTPDQHCWVERDQVTEREKPNGRGALVGALIGGILGHSVTRGNGAATVGGAIAGGAIGANVGRDEYTHGENVQHCEDVPAGPPQYWDVAYQFHGDWHHVQMSEPPGPTIVVNRDGEPRQ